MDNEEEIQIITGVPCDRELFRELLPDFAYEPKEEDGYIKYPCEKCECLMWIGPKQRVKKQTENLPVLCIQCVANMQNKDDSIDVKHLGGP